MSNAVGLLGPWDHQVIINLEMRSRPKIYYVKSNVLLKLKG